MYVATVPNRGSPPAILLRESYRAGKAVKTRTLANLSHWPAAQVETLRRVLRGEPLVAPGEAFEILRSRPHGHVAAVLGTLRRLGLDQIVAPTRSRPRDVVLALVVARLLAPCSKLATAQGLHPKTVHSTLGESLDLDVVEADELYEALDWLHARQAQIEDALAQRHLHEGTLVLYDVTSTSFEGHACPLAQIGHSREGKKNTLQIVFGLLCNGEGCPVAVEVFDGNTGDPTTLASQVQKIRARFGLRHVVLVGDRGLITDARIRQDLRPVDGVAWITALRAPAIRQLVEGGILQLSVFDTQDLAELTSPDYPGERLIVCKNPFMAEERARKRGELLAATEKLLAEVAAATRRAQRPLRGRAEIGMRVGKVLGRFKVGKHFMITITDETFRFERDQDKIAQEAALDGIYVIRTSVPADALSPAATVRAYKQLSTVERAFRSFKSLDLRVRPIYHHLEDRVRAHVFLCMLAYYVEWHMRRAVAPLLFDDHMPPRPERSPVAPAKRSAEAEAKARHQQLEDGTPVQSFQSLLKDLATLTNNRVQAKIGKDQDITFDMLTTPTPLQQRAFDLLGVSPRLH